MSKYKRQEKYEKENCIRINIKLNKKTDKDIIAALDLSTGNKTASIKNLIRQGIEK